MPRIIPETFVARQAPGPVYGRVQPEIDHVGPNAAMDLALKGTALVGQLSQGADVLAKGVGGYMAKGSLANKRAAAQAALARQQGGAQPAAPTGAQAPAPGPQPVGQPSPEAAVNHLAALRKMQGGVGQMDTGMSPVAPPPSQGAGYGQYLESLKGQPLDPQEAQRLAADQWSRSMDVGDMQRGVGNVSMAGLQQQPLARILGGGAAMRQPQQAPMPAEPQPPAQEPPAPEAQPQPEQAAVQPAPAAQPMPQPQGQRQPGLRGRLLEARSSGVPATYDELLGWAEAARGDADPMTRKMVLDMFDEAGGGGVAPSSWTDLLTGEHLTRAKMTLADRMHAKPVEQESDAKGVLDTLRTLRAMKLGEEVAGLRGKRGVEGDVEVALPTEIGTSAFGQAQLRGERGRAAEREAVGENAPQKQAGVAAAAAGRGQYERERGAQAGSIIGGQIKQRAAQTALSKAKRTTELERPALVRAQTDLTRAKQATEWERPEYVREQTRNLRLNGPHLRAMWDRMPGSAFAGSNIDYKRMMTEFMDLAQKRNEALKKSAVEPVSRDKAFESTLDLSKAGGMAIASEQDKKKSAAEAEAHAQSMRDLGDVMLDAMQRGGVSPKDIEKLKSLIPPKPEE